MLRQSDEGCTKPNKRGRTKRIAVPARGVSPTIPLTNVAGAASLRGGFAGVRLGVRFSMG
jgi:hypothetical protein